MAEEAQVVFCPYSYVINPVVRRAMDVDIKGSILIIDEAQYVVLLVCYCFYHQVCMTNQLIKIVYVLMLDFLENWTINLSITPTCNASSLDIALLCFCLVESTSGAFVICLYFESVSSGVPQLRKWLAKRSV